MNSKITGAFVGILVIIFTSTVLYIDFSTERIYQDDPRFFADHPNAVPDHILKVQLVDEISLTKIVEIDREKIFKRDSIKLLQEKLTTKGLLNYDFKFNLDIKITKELTTHLPKNYVYFHYKKKFGSNYYQNVVQYE